MEKEKKISKRKVKSQKSFRKGMEWKLGFKAVFSLFFLCLFFGETCGSVGVGLFDYICGFLISMRGFLVFGNGFFLEDDNDDDDDDEKKVYCLL